MNLAGFEGSIGHKRASAFVWYLEYDTAHSLHKSSQGLHLWGTSFDFRDPHLKGRLWPSYVSLFHDSLFLLYFYHEPRFFSLFSSLPTREVSWRIVSVRFLSCREGLLFRPETVQSTVTAPRFSAAAPLETCGLGGSFKSWNRPEVFIICMNQSRCSVWENWEASFWAGYVWPGASGMTRLENAEQLQCESSLPVGELWECSIYFHKRWLLQSMEPLQLAAECMSRS